MIKDYLICILTILLITCIFLLFQHRKDPAKNPLPQAQKFRFGEQCPDGLKVEYISTIRLPKSMLCQKAVGE